MPKTERSGHTTTDHGFIRQWVEERGGWPARVKGTGSDDDAGLIRIDFKGYSGGDTLEKIDWDDWFQAFDSRKLAFLHRDLEHAGNDLDRFNKLVRDGNGGSARGRSAAKKTTRAGKTSRASKTTGEGRSPGTRRTAAGNGGSRSANGSARKRTTRRPSGEEMTEMRELLLHELGDLLYAERRFLTATRTMAREAQDPKVRGRIEEHVQETEVQIERLQDAFRAVGERPRAVRCEGAIGLREEHDSFKSDERPSPEVLSAFDLGSGLRVEHYEIAGYKSAMAIANALGEKDCAAMLKESLREEQAMASFLERNAPLALRKMVAQERAEEGGSMLRGLRNAVGL
jgi:ferritin-like metal-binding protein YciE